MFLLIVLEAFCLAGAAYLVGEAVTLPARERRTSEADVLLLQEKLRSDADQNFEAISESHKKRADRKEARLSDLEETLHDRHKELDERESELDLRQAQLTADVEIRTDKLEEREQALAELGERLANQERELGEYVARAQTEIQRRESEWWKQQLGEGASAA